MGPAPYGYKVILGSPGGSNPPFRSISVIFPFSPSGLKGRAYFSECSRFCLPLFACIAKMGSSYFLFMPMSYHGYSEYLCASGHHHRSDVYAATPVDCPLCDGPWIWHHRVDHPHSLSPSVPCVATVVALPPSEIWRTDPLGNRYIHTEPRYAPASQGPWRHLCGDLSS